MNDQWYHFISEVSLSSKMQEQLFIDPESIAKKYQLDFQQLKLFISDETNYFLAFSSALQRKRWHIFLEILPSAKKNLEIYPLKRWFLEYASEKGLKNSTYRYEADAASFMKYLFLNKELNPSATKFCKLNWLYYKRLEKDFMLRLIYENADSIKGEFHFFYAFKKFKWYGSHTNLFQLAISFFNAFKEERWKSRILKD